MGIKIVYGTLREGMSFKALKIPQSCGECKRKDTDYVQDKSFCTATGKRIRDLDKISDDCPFFSDDCPFFKTNTAK